jgi:hypothetical protein
MNETALSMLGGALLIAHFDAGPLSIDHGKEKREAEVHGTRRMEAHPPFLFRGTGWRSVLSSTVMHRGTCPCLR